MSVKIGMSRFPVDGCGVVRMDVDVEEGYAAVRSRMLNGVFKVRGQGVQVQPERVCVVRIPKVTEPIIYEVIVTLRWIWAGAYGGGFDVTNADFS